MLISLKSVNHVAHFTFVTEKNDHMDLLPSKICLV